MNHRFSLTLFLIFIAAIPVRGQCQGGFCPNQGSNAITIMKTEADVPLIETQVVWSPLIGLPDWLGLWQGERFLGRLNLHSGEWIRSDGSIAQLNPLVGLPGIAKSNSQKDLLDRSIHKKDPPANLEVSKRKKLVSPVPELEKPKELKQSNSQVENEKEKEKAENEKEKEPINYGNDWQKSDENHRYSLSGHPCSLREAIEALRQGDTAIPDDSDRLRLTVIGAPIDRHKVELDWQTLPQFAPWKNRVIFKSYPADHWAVKNSGFVTTGKPTIYFQNAKGQVLHRQEDYVGGAAQLVEALRRADPNYDPSKDLDRRTTNKSTLSPHLPAVLSWGIALLFLLFILLKK